MQSEKKTKWFVLDILLFGMLLCMPIFFCVSAVSVLTETNLEFSSFTIEDLLIIKLVSYSILEIICIIAYGVFYGKMRKKGRQTLGCHVMMYLKKNKTKSILFLTLFLGIFFLIIIYYGQNRILYYPTYSEGCEYYLNDRKNVFDEITVESASGEKYIGWLHKSENKSKSTIVYFGGNMESSAVSMVNRTEEAQWEIYKDYNFLMIDYPGYGRSEGYPSEENIFAMAKSVMDYVTSEETLNGEIIVMGFSLGTGVANYVASQYDVDGLILLAPYDEIRNVYNSYLNIFYGPLKVLMRNKYASIKYVSEVKVDTLVVASEDDETIPFKLSQNLVENFQTSVDFYTIEGATHNEVATDNEVQKKIKEYLLSRATLSE